MADSSPATTPKRLADAHLQGLELADYLGGFRVVYGKEGITVPLEMRLDSKHRNVGFLALSGRCTVTSLTTANSHNRT